MTKTITVICKIDNIQEDLVRLRLNLLKSLELITDQKQRTSFTHILLLRFYLDGPCFHLLTH